MKMLSYQYRNSHYREQDHLTYNGDTIIRKDILLKWNPSDGDGIAAGLELDDLSISLDVC